MTTDEPTPKRRLPTTAALVWPPLLVTVAVVVAWQLYAKAAHSDPAVLPTPGRVLHQGWQFRSDLWQNTLPTLKETAIGFGFSIAAAWVIATALDFSAIVRRGLYPLLIATQTVPLIAIAPLFVIWFGFGLAPKVLLVALVTFFPLVVNLIEGFAGTDADATRLLRSMGAGPLTRFVKLRVPSAMPSFFTGLRISITYAIVGAVFAEYAGAENGLGIYMQEQKSSHRTDLVFAAVIVTALLSIALFAATYLLQRLVLPWQRVLRKDGR